MSQSIHNPLYAIRRRKGIALLMVLLIVLAITILATGFLAGTDTELACGANTLLRVQMDQLAQSGLEHARGLVLHPQDVPAAFWASGATDQQLVADSRDYYAVQASRDANDYCVYNITCEAYRLLGAEKTGRSRLAAKLRLDPCIGLWAGGKVEFRKTWTLRGDMRSGGRVVSLAAKESMDGDVFSAGLDGSIVGQLSDANQLSLVWPPVTGAYVDPNYVNGVVSGTLSSTSRQPAIWRSAGDLVLAGNVTIEGMLLVAGNLTIRGDANKISAAKNLPALYVSGNLAIEDVNGVQIDGLVVVDHDIRISAAASNVTVTGATFAGGTLVETATDASGNGNNAIISSQPSWRPEGGQAAGAIELDGADDYLQTPDSATQLQLAQAYTLSLWIKPASAQNGDAGILCKTDKDGQDNHWSLQFNDTSPKRLVVYHGTIDWDTGITLNNVGNGAWHHVAIVRQGDGTLVSYLDGVLRQTMDPCDPFKTAAPISAEGHLNIGADRTCSPDRLYHGLMDDVRIYDCELAPSDVARLHALTTVATAPIGYWRFDESGSQVRIVADPMRAAIVSWESGAAKGWSPAAGGFYRSIRRQ